MFCLKSQKLLMMEGEDSLYISDPLRKTGSQGHRGMKRERKKTGPGLGEEGQVQEGKGHSCHKVPLPLKFTRQELLFLGGWVLFNLTILIINTLTYWGEGQALAFSFS